MIRALTIADTSALSQLACDTFYHTYAYANTQKDMEEYMAKHFNEASLKSEIEAKNITYYGYSEENKLLAYLKVMRGIDASGNQSNTTAELARLYLHYTLHKNGIGRQLVEHAVNNLKKEGFNTIWLSVWQQNTKAIAFYERTGFKQTGVTQFVLGNDVQDDFVYTRTF